MLARLVILLMQVASIEQVVAFSTSCRSLAPCLARPTSLSTGSQTRGNAFTSSNHLEFITARCRNVPVMLSSADERMPLLPSNEKLPSLPALVGPIGGRPLLPGSSQIISDPSPGQTAAMKTALAFAAVDNRLGGKPVLAYFSSNEADQSNQGVATIASIEEVGLDADGEIDFAVIVGVGRAVCPRVKIDQRSGNLVAEKWQRKQDVPPAASYMHSLEMMRPLEDEATAEHNERRRMMAKLAHSSVDLQLCNLDGVCNTDMLLELGPEVYSKAQELIAMAAGSAASSNQRTRGPVNAALTSLPQLAKKGVKRVAFWDALYPQFGDEVDGEMQYLRCFSWACWQALDGVVSNEEYAEAMASTDTMERILKAAWKFSEHKKEIVKAQLVLDTLGKVSRGEK